MPTASKSPRRIRSIRPGATVAARFRSVPASQRRGHETMERFAEAAEALLEHKTFEEIALQEIVRRAGKPIGSFYARFASKEALLPLLYQRYHQRLGAWFTARLGRVDWDRLGFEACVREMVEFIVGGYEERPGLLRAIALFARLRPDALPADLVPERRRIYSEAIEILARHRARIAHDDAEAAIRFGLFLVSTVARERLLFGNMPLARVTPINRESLRAELVRTLHSYLTCEAPR